MHFLPNNFFSDNDDLFFYDGDSGLICFLAVMVTMMIVSKITGEANVRQWKKQRHQEWSNLAQRRQHKEGGGGSFSTKTDFYV